jgi:N4-gp56 family major capsid protein
MTTVTVPNQLLEIYSREAIFESMAQLYFRQFVKFKREFNIEPGLNVNFLKINNLPLGEELASETTPVPINSYSDSVVSFNVKEHANSIRVSSLRLQSSYRPVLEDMVKLLGRDYGIVLDNVCRDAFLATANKQYAGGSANTAAIGTGDTFKLAEVLNAVEVLQTVNAPMLNRMGDQHYVCVVHPHQARDLIEEDKWENWQRYTKPEMMYNGEIGRIYNTVFLRTTQMPILAGAGAGAIDVYRSVLFGDATVGFGELLPMELRNDGVDELGRFLRLGWYSVFGAGPINDYSIEIQTA